MMPIIEDIDQIPQRPKRRFKRLVMALYHAFSSNYTGCLFAFCGGIASAVAGNSSAAIVWVLVLIILYGLNTQEKLIKTQRELLDIYRP